MFVDMGGEDEGEEEMKNNENKKVKGNSGKKREERGDFKSKGKVD